MDLGRLFSLLNGRQTVLVAVEGALPAGKWMYAELSLTIVPTGGSTAISVAPNPMNPVGVFRFATSRAGRVRIALFDAQGRLVRLLADEPRRAGEQAIVFDGTNRQGRPMASGVYFARIETVDGSFRKRVAIVK